MSRSNPGLLGVRGASASTGSQASRSLPPTARPARHEAMPSRAREAAAVHNRHQMGKEEIMRRFCLVTSFIVALTLTLGYGTALAGQSLVAQINTDKVYSLQIIAHDRCPKGTFDNSNRRSIAVLADFTPDVNTGDVFINIEDKRNLIFLRPGPTFQVLDGNACNQGGAVFQLPPDVSTSFEVWVRLVGKPGSGLDVTTCAVIAVDLNPADALVVGDVVCSTSSLMRTRLTGKGEPRFTNETNTLLKLVNAGIGCNPCDLFDPNLQDFFWKWGTTGRPHAQLVFVEANAR